MILTLVVITALALSAAATARYASATIHAGSNVDAALRRQVAADGALRAALDQIRAGTSPCLYETAADVAMPGFDLQFAGSGAGGSIGVDLACRSFDGPVDSPSTWAAALTGEGLVSPNRPLATSGATDVTLGGPLFLPSLSSGDLSQIAGSAVAVDGPVVYGAGSCTTPVAPTAISAVLAFVSPLVDRPVCTQVAWQAQPSFHSPTLAANLATPAPALPPTTAGGCEVFTPGVYDDDPATTAIPDLPSVDSDDAFFTSGDYVFIATQATTTNWDVTLRNSHDVVAGRATGLTPLHASGWNCTAAFNADGGGGATFYLAGRAHVVVRDGATLEMMPRIQPGGEAVAIQALCGAGAWCDGTPGGIPPSQHTVNPLPGAAPFPNPSRDALRIRPNSSVVIHGMVYAPRAQIRLDGTAGDGNQLLGGIVAARLSLGADSALGPTTLDVAPAPIDLLVTAVATDVAGETTTMLANVRYDPTLGPDDRVVVTAWHLCDPSGC